MIEPVQEFKYLGVFLDPILKWDHHVEFLSRQLRPLLGILYKTRSIIPRNVSLMIYHSMIHSRLSYMIELWGAASASRWTSIQILQNRALRCIFDLPYLTPRIHIYKDVCPRILPVRALYEFHVSKFLFKARNGLILTEKNFQCVSHSYMSRQRGLLVKPRCRFEFTKNRIMFAGPHIYNSLPESIKESRTLKSFVLKSRMFFMDNVDLYLQY